VGTPECQSNGDLATQLDHVAATKMVHPNVDYEVGRDGHLMKPADQLAGDAASRGIRQR
jgi:hypothetical protein